VLILHGSAGIDGRGDFHGKALNAAGIATLEIFMFSCGNRPRAGRNKNFTHMYGALKYLASRPEIDPARMPAGPHSDRSVLTVILISQFMLP
jgi:hypothetical protein